MKLTVCGFVANCKAFVWKSVFYRNPLSCGGKPVSTYMDKNLIKNNNYRVIYPKNYTHCSYESNRHNECSSRLRQCTYLRERLIVCFSFVFLKI